MYAEMPPCTGDVKSEWRQLLDSWRAGDKVHVDDLQELVFRGGSTGRAGRSGGGSGPRCWVDWEDGAESDTRGSAGLRVRAESRWADG